MTSIFEKALGADFARLHPMLQRRFGFSSADGIACIGRGTMTDISRGPWWTLPFLRLGSWRNILFPESGRDVPFTIENYAYVDGFGRETVTFVRTFELAPTRRRRFDATMVYDPERGGLVDYLGTHQHLAVDLEMSVGSGGELLLRSRGQRFYEGPLGFPFPLLLSGVADLTEAYDDERGLYTIDVRVTHRRRRHLFGYRGEFTCEFPEVPPGGVPPTVKPLREERRT
ncbi:MAG TPA: DUF4166 domain-containing protein [Cryptosporangiaceae bacterium]|nr:DUF4166 domain-containing protein [Cryptosporangiaceae bacterium]